jgi:hypothetical protein
MTRVSVLAPAAFLELYWADEWVVAAEHAARLGLIDAPGEWSGDVRPEPLGSAVLLDVFASRAHVAHCLQAWQQIAGKLHGAGELMLVDAAGRGVAGPWPVLGLLHHAAG